MTAEKILLSICIPTYNRCEYLKKSIQSIICQRPFIDGDVEIVISDNASTDNTEEVANEFVKKYKNIIYFRNESNIRDKNFPLALSRGRGILRKLSNDTLIYSPNSLIAICKIIQEREKERPIIFFGNSELKRGGLFEFVKAVKNIGYWITSIGCLSVWEDYCVDIESQIEGCDLFLWQVKFFLNMSSTKNSVLIENNKLFSAQSVQGKDISYGLYQVFYNNYLLIIKSFVDTGKLSLDVLNYLEKDMLMNFFIQWIIKWELKSKNLNYSKEENLKHLVFSVCKNKPYYKEFRYRYFVSKIKCLIKRPFSIVKSHLLVK